MSIEEDANCETNLTLMDAMLLLSFGNNGFSYWLHGSLGYAIYFELVLRDRIKLGKMANHTFMCPWNDYLISSVCCHPSTNIPILERAVKASS